MATLRQVYGMLGNADLKNRITVAVAKLGYYIVATEAPETANHANRLIWANQVLAGPEAMANKMMWAVLQNADVQTAILAGVPDEAAFDTLVEYVVGITADVFATGA